MALASQSARKSSSGRLYTSRRRGSRRAGRTRRLLGLAILGALVISTGWWWMSRKPAPTPAGAAPTEHLAGATEPSATPAPTRAGSNTTGFNLSNIPTNRTDRSAAPGGPGDSADAPETPVLTMGEQPAATAPAIPDDAPESIMPPASSAALTSLITDADNALAANEPLVARLLLNRALGDPRADATFRSAIRDRLTAINDTLLFSPRVVEGDPLTERYVIKPGDSLAKIVSHEGLKIDWRLLKRINRISDPRRIRVGQTIKLVRGPFMAVIHKSAYRLDLYAMIGADDSAESRLYIRSFPVGLGQYGSTPVGSWVVRKNSKLINPPWTNPLTGEHFSADNPKNPIGERWIGLEGTDENTTVLAGYGLHGTIDPGSVGAEASMGCVRLHEEDVDLLYEMLTERDSRVEIVP